MTRATPHRPDPLVRIVVAGDWLQRVQDEGSEVLSSTVFREWYAEPLNRATFEQTREVWDAIGQIEPRMADRTFRSGWTPSRPKKPYELRLLSTFCARLILTVCALLPRLLSSDSDGAIPAMYYCAPLGEHKSVRLIDGSTIDLNSNTCVAATFSKKERSLRVASGEVIFEVVHDPDRPFVVASGRVLIKDLGTRFDVNSTESGTKVLVMEGSLRIYPRNKASRRETWTIAAGQQIEVPDDTSRMSRVSHVAPEDVVRLTEWCCDIVTLENRPLKEALAAFARYRKIRFKSTDSHLLDLRVTGVFDRRDVDRFLNRLREACIQSRSEYDDKGQRLVTLARVAGVRRRDECW